MNKIIKIAFIFFLAISLGKATIQINILAATYGTQDVTKQVKSLYEQGENILASNSIFGDPIPGVLKVLTVVYELTQQVYTQTVMENQEFNILDDDVDVVSYITDSEDQQVFKILGASYGPKTVTQQVQNIIDESQQIKASNEIFGDTLPGWDKFLTIIYQKNGQIFTKVIKEGNLFRKQDINIIGATYGSKVVTDVVKSMFQEGKKIQASDDIFGDSMPGTTKFLVVIYEEDGKIQTKIIREGQLFYQGLQAKVVIIGAAYGSADVKEKVNEIYQTSSLIRASNGVFGDPDFGIFKTLTITYYDNELGYITKVCQENESIQLP